MENDNRESGASDLLRDAGDLMGQPRGEREYQADDGSTGGAHAITSEMGEHQSLATERSGGYSQGSMREGGSDESSTLGTESEGETDLARGYSDQTSIGDSELNLSGGYARGMLDDVEEHRGKKD